MTNSAKKDNKNRINLRHKDRGLRSCGFWNEKLRHIDLQEQSHERNDLKRGFESGAISHKAMEKAWEQYRMAKHLLEVTMSIINDPKLLIGIINNLLTAVKEASKIIGKEKLGKEGQKLIAELAEIVDFQKKSTLEFKRGQKIVICNPEYEMNIVDKKKIKDYLQRTKKLLDKAERG